MSQKTEDLRKALKAAERADAENARKLMKSTRKEWRFTLTKVESGFDRIRPGSGVIVYRLQGEVENSEECLAAGYSDSDLSGGMSYYFNEATRMFVGSTGGGRVYIRDTGDFFSESETYETFTKLEAFLVENPDGGDVTGIITSQENFKW